MGSFRYMVLIAVTLSTSQLAAQQPDPLTDFEITGRVY